MDWVMSLTSDFLKGSIGSGFDADAMAAALEALDRQVFDPLTKGFPPAHAPLALGDIANHSWNLLAGDLTAPVAVMRKSALEHNARWMRHLLDKFGLQLAPHAKTTMTPHLWAQQAAHGCWGLTVATVQQAEVAAAFGCRNVLIANQVTGRSQVRGIVELNHAHAALEIFVLVDSIAGLKALSDDVAAAKTEHPVNVLLEFGFQGGRTGCRTLDEVSQLLDELPSIRVACGLPAWPAMRARSCTPSGAEDGPRVEAYFDQFAEAVQLADRRNAFLTDEVILTAGGSSYYDIVGRRLGQIELRKPTVKILRSGCYVTHDCGTYVEHLGADEAARSCCRQGSRPARARLVRLLPGAIGAGAGPGAADHGQARCRLRHPSAAAGLALSRARDAAAGTDAQGLEDHQAQRPARLSQLPANADIAVGDLLCCGISHPCTTFDRWRLIHVVDDGWTSLGAVPTFF